METPGSIPLGVAAGVLAGDDIVVELSEGAAIAEGGTTCWTLVQPGEDENAPDGAMKVVAVPVEEGSACATFGD